MKLRGHKLGCDCGEELFRVGRETSGTIVIKCDECDTIYRIGSAYPDLIKEEKEDG